MARNKNNTICEKFKAENLIESRVDNCSLANWQYNANKKKKNARAVRHSRDDDDFLLFVIIIPSSVVARSSELSKSFARPNGK